MYFCSSHTGPYLKAFGHLVPKGPPYEWSLLNGLSSRFLIAKFLGQAIHLRDDGLSASSLYF